MNLTARFAKGLRQARKEVSFNLAIPIAIGAMAQSFIFLANIA